MNEDKTGQEAGAALWARARGTWLESVGPIEAPDPTTLAAYLDGRLDEADAAGVEAWMVADADALDRVIGLRKAMAASPAKVPGHVVKRARGAVRGRSKAGSGWAGWGAGVADTWAGVMYPAAWAGVALIAVTIFDVITRRFFVLGSTKLQELESQ